MSAILVCGAGGMLGRAWLELLEARGIEARAADLPGFDLGDAASIAAAVVPGLRAVVNCAAYTDVDGAETHEALATEINGAGVARLVARCDEVGVPLIHYSTDYVFDGEATAPYAVDRACAPLNAYGRSKRAGEEAVLASIEAGGPHLVVRTSWLYAPWGKNFVLTIAKLAAERPELRVVDDQRGRPTSAQHLAQLSLGLLERGQRGVFHGTDGGECTWFDFASAIAATVAPACRVVPCTSDEYPRPARRPTYSVLDLSRTEAVLGPMPDWRENLAAVLAAR
ncbi:MAG: dTDP-4-dehydrorhamnose reductase [Myxococcales bacterium]|nr:dTDP-4-dehydrorhamnose reductase [Myxococcales bacterium]